jgi:glycosyltransferase involved in cell wall biosynthesis
MTARAAPDVTSLQPGNGVASNKIVFVNRYFHPDESATSRVLSDLAFRLAALGIRVAVVTSRQLYDDPRAGLPGYEQIAGFSVHRVATATQGRGRLAGRGSDYVSFHAAAGVKLLQVLAPGDVVVAKTDPPLISVSVSIAARLRGALLVNWLQDIFPEVAVALGMRIPAWVSRSLQFARDRSLRRSALNVVLGERMRAHLLALGIQSERIRIVPNSTDVRAITPRPVEQSATRQRLDLNGQFVVGYSGNLGRAHEFETLLGAARLLRANRRFVFLFTGGGAKMESLQQAARAEGLDSFRFLPHQPPDLLADSLAAADVHIVSLLPELEGLIVPSKLYGILAAGRPAVFIGDTQGEVALVVSRHACGIAVPAGDSERLATELLELSDAPDRLQTMGDNGRRLVVSRYGSERAAADWQQILVSLAPASLQPLSS